MEKPQQVAILNPSQSEYDDDSIDKDTEQSFVPAKHAITKQKKKTSKNSKNDQKCKKKNFQVNMILKNDQKDIDGVKLEKTQENAVVLYGLRQPNIENVIFKPMSENCVYFVAGDIIVEPRDCMNGEERIKNGDIFNKFKNITSVESYKNSLQFNLESVKPLLNLDQIIYCLENSQDTSNYEYAQSLRRFQPTILRIEDLIGKAIDIYSSDQSALEELLKQREKYLLQQQNKVLEELASQGAFACVCLLSLSFSNKTFQVAHISLTKHSIAILGADFNSALTHLMRKGFMNFFDHQSRRMLYRSTIEHFADIKTALSFTLPSFEVLTADGITLVCDCHVSCKSVEFPENLQFKGAEVQQLNDIESINVMKFTVTPKIVNSVLNIRKTNPSNFAEQIELQCFEYAMRSSILLDKFYPSFNRSLGSHSKNRSMLMECGYKKINTQNEKKNNQVTDKKKDQQ